VLGLDIYCSLFCWLMQSTWVLVTVENLFSADNVWNRPERLTRSKLADSDDVSSG